MTQEEALAEFFALLPENGDKRTYQEVYDELLASGKINAAQHFHKLRRAGLLAVESDLTSGRGVLVVGRPAADPA